jgi:hypothetical protein
MRTLRAPRPLLATAALAGVALLAAACGSSAAPGAATPTVTTTVTVTAPPSASGGSGISSPTPPNSPEPGGPAACSTSSLKLTIGQGNGAAGSVYYPIVFTNSSGASCTLQGFPGVSFVTGQNGSQIGNPATRNSDAPAQAITLDPGAVAHATLQVAQALNFPKAKCQLTTAHWLKVYPPNETEPVFVPFTAQACATTAADVNVLNVAPVTTGSSDG